MGINQYNKPKPEKEESDFDKVLKGLQVANQITGTVADFKKLDQMKAESDLRLQADERQREEFKFKQNAEGRAQKEFESKFGKNLLDVNKIDQFDVSQKPGAGRVQAQLPDGSTVYVKAKPAANANQPPKGMKYVLDEVTGQPILVPIQKPIPAASATKIGGYLGAAQASSAIEDKAVGLKTGKTEAFKDWAKELLGFQKEDRAQALADIGTQRNEVMSRIAGANVTPDEKTRVQEGIPTRTDAPEAFMGKAKSTTDKLINDAQAEIDALEAAGYDTSGMKKKLTDFKNKVGASRQARTQPKQDGGGPTPEEIAAAQQELIRRQGMKAGIGLSKKKGQ